MTAKGIVRRLFVVALAFAAIYCIRLTYCDFRPTASILFADVGQGKCILVVAPNGRTMVIDAGTQTYGQDSWDELVAQRILSRFARIGVSKLDVISVTHPDEDHYNVVPTLVIELKPKLFWMPVGESAEADWQAIKTLMLDKDVEMVVAQVGQRLWLDTKNGMVVEVLGPPKGISARQPGSSSNSASTVFKLRFKEVSALFTGDVDEMGQRWLISSGADLRAAILDVPHHGSRHNLKTFLLAVRPKIAVISAGRKNPFGHPDPSTVEILLELGANVWVTGERGSLLIETDGRNFDLTKLQ